ncbi:MAG: DUF4342 domain-containing protein [Halanaerobiaceae bacterium]
MDNLNKIDRIRDRFNVSYAEAERALRENDGDLIRALISLEESADTAFKAERESNQFRVKGRELISRIKELIQEGNINKIVVKNNQQTLLEIPVTAGIAGLVLFPYMTVLGGMAALYKDYTLEIERAKEKETVGSKV